ncbi:uncharacterized protein SCODWIG_03764 [Saccharomycodes ludwigii]|uniref:Arrestin C-terminal-like domain-containing protein n=1 Tax=Saccharomycodes ludwigii TaxID=36035 RepID=A0A376BBE0_9ASCO|nr:uncharacterized protein SCODWIG_03764 [Saccharomycodes ludwigii]
MPLPAPLRATTTTTQLIPLSYPETIKATFGSVEYFLEVLIERTGTFKSNIHYKHPIKIIRTQSDSSVEETEPISIVRDWEDQLHYDILIASKDIVLDAFLPISFNLTPLDKVSLHRVRIYLTETMEYYCKFKKVHRLEPTKKFLLCELKAPPLPKLPKDKNKNKAKNLGNLLEDNNKNGYITYKEFDFQVYVPEVLNSQNRVHPDTTYENIKANHWIKVCLRLSKLVDGKQKHFEISIDSPIHVLDKQCSHANTLLPSYTSHLSIPSFIHNTTTTTNNNNNNNNNNTVASGNNAVNSPSVTQYHGSNLYFPKEILYSPLLSPNVEPININGHHNNAMSLISLNDNRHTSNNNNNHHHHRKAVLGISSSRNASVEDFILHSPELRSNIYTPDNLKAELMSPQAVPLGSPTLSPTLSPVIPTSTTPPPPFSEEPSNPPTYADVLKKDGIIPRKGAITTSNSNTSTTENERDFAEGFNFHHSAFPALAPQMRKSNSVSYGNVGDNYNSNGHNLYNDISTVLLNSNDPVHLSPSVSPLKPMASPTSKPTLLKNDKEVDIENFLLKPNSPKKSTDNHNDNQLSDEGDLSAISSLSGSPINSTGLLRKSMDSGISTSSSMISNTNANVGSHNNHGNHLDVPGKRLSTDSDDGGMVPLLQRISRQNTNTTESPTTYTEGRLHNAGNLRFSPSPTRSTNNRNSVYNNTGMDSEMYNSNQLGNANAGRYVEGHGHAKVNNPFAASEESFLDKYSKVEDASIDLAALLSRSAETTPQHLLLRKHDQCKYANANNGSNVAARKNVPTNDTNNKLHCHNSNASSGSSNNVMFELNSEGGNSNNTDIINKENYSNYGNKNLELNDAESGLNASFNAKEKYGLKYVQENDILNDFSSMMK